MKETEVEKLNHNLVRDKIDFMVKTLYKDSHGTVWAQILAYKDARTDMDILDDVCGPSQWQNKYQRDSKGVLQCGIGVYIDELNDWVWKWSNGVPSQFEKEKGEYSDAMKRAGYMWGIGRCLYAFPRIAMQLNEKEYYVKNDKIKLSNYFRPNGDDWIWEVDEFYYKVTAHQKFGNRKVLRFDSKPYVK